MCLRAELVLFRDVAAIRQHACVQAAHLRAGITPACRHRHFSGIVASKNPEPYSYPEQGNDESGLG